MSSISITRRYYYTETKFQYPKILLLAKSFVNKANKCIDDRLRMKPLNARPGLTHWTVQITGQADQASHCVYCSIRRACNGPRRRTVYLCFISRFMVCI